MTMYIYGCSLLRSKWVEKPLQGPYLQKESIPSKADGIQFVILQQHKKAL